MDPLEKQLEPMTKKSVHHWRKFLDQPMTLVYNAERKYMYRLMLSVPLIIWSESKLTENSDLNGPIKLPPGPIAGVAGGLVCVSPVYKHWKMKHLQIKLTSPGY